MWLKHKRWPYQRINFSFFLSWLMIVVKFAISSIQYKLDKKLKQVTKLSTTIAIELLGYKLLERDIKKNFNWKPVTNVICFFLLIKKSNKIMISKLIHKRLDLWLCVMQFPFDLCRYGSMRKGVKQDQCKCCIVILMWFLSIDVLCVFVLQKFTTSIFKWDLWKPCWMNILHWISPKILM